MVSVLMKVLLLLLSCLLAYIWGKRRGYEAGLEKGRVEGLLECRIKGLEMGRCQTCGGKVGDTIYPLEAYGNNNPTKMRELDVG